MAVPPDVEAALDRLREQRDDLDSRRAVQLRAVEPLLEALGWDLRGGDVEPDVEVDGRRVDYLLHVGDEPAVAVRTSEPGSSVADEHARALFGVLRATPVDCGLATDGRRVALLATSGDDVHRRLLELPELASSPELLEPFARQRAVERVESRRDDRTVARRRLDRDREAAVEAVTDAVVSVAGSPVEDLARRAAVELVDELALPADGASSRDAPGRDARDSRASETGDGDAIGDESAEYDAGAVDVSAADDAARNVAAPESRRSGDADDRERDADDREGDTAGDDLPAERGEYVARFFGGRSSVGAVGAESPGGALAASVEYLRANHGLAGSVELPWGVADGRATLAPAPEHPDGTRMDRYEAVDGDCYVWTGSGEDRARRAVEELADAVGLRVMFQGDW